MNIKTFCATLAVASITAFATGAYAHMAPPKDNLATSTAPADNVVDNQANVATPPPEVGNSHFGNDATTALILAGNTDVTATADPPNVDTHNAIANALKRDLGSGLANKAKVTMGAPPDMVMHHGSGRIGFYGTGVTNGGHNQGGEDGAANDDQDADDDTGCVNTATATLRWYTPRK